VLEKINTRIQYEIKNPISSIVAQNIEKGELYRSLKGTTELFYAMQYDMDAETLAMVSKDFCQRQLDIIDKLMRGL
jgi:hypothetical protein